MIDVKSLTKHLLTFHLQSPEKNVFIFSTARSDTTWLAEIIATQGRFKIVNNPFDLRWPVKHETLGLDDREELLHPENRPAIKSYIELHLRSRDRDIRFKRESPFSDFWHLYTNRIIFKIFFAGEDCKNWFRDELNNHTILLLRRPIPASLSRRKSPRLRSFLTPPYSNNFSRQQVDHALSVLDEGEYLQTAVRDWCLQNAIRLRSVEPNWTVLSHEQLVLQPELVLRQLADTLSLPALEKMLNRMFVASGSSRKSIKESRRGLLDSDQMRQNRTQPVDMWKAKVTPEQEVRAFDTLSVFGIDYYEHGNLLAKDKYVLKHNGKSMPAD